MFKKILKGFGIISGIIVGAFGLANLITFIDLKREGKSYTKFVKEAFEVGVLYAKQY